MATQDELSANASPQKPGKPTGEPIDTYLMIGAIGAIAIAVIVPWLPLSNSQFETLGWIAGRGAIATFIITLFSRGLKKAPLPAVVLLRFFSLPFCSLGLQ